MLIENLLSNNKQIDKSFWQNVSTTVDILNLHDDDDDGDDGDDFAANKKHGSQ